MADAELFAEIAREVAAHGRVVLATCVGVKGSGPSRLGRKVLVRPDGSFSGTIGGGPFEALVVREALALLAERGHTRRQSFDFFAAGKSAPTPMICGGSADVFFETLSDRPLLVVAGGGHVGQALARLAPELDFAVLVVDDRDEFVAPQRFPAEVRTQRVERDFALPELGQRELYIALVTRCWETDLAALRHIFGASKQLDLRYLGLIGSRRKVREVLKILADEGVPKKQLAAIQAPIGLDIGAVTPAEIAVSILAQMVQVRNQKP